MHHTWRGYPRPLMQAWPKPGKQWLHRLVVLRQGPSRCNDKTHTSCAATCKLLHACMRGQTI